MLTATGRCFQIAIILTLTCRIIGGGTDTAAIEGAEESDTTVLIAETSTSTFVSPFEDLFGPTLIYLAPSDDGKSVQPQSKPTLEALDGKSVVGVYFSADWCGPCRNFTPELVSFYQKINKRRQNDFEIVWVSRCRAVSSHFEFFAHMGGWMSLPPEEAMGQRGSRLNDRFKVKGIPTLVLLDSQGKVITKDGRNKIPQDKAGIGFPYRNPIATLYIALIPQSLRNLAKRQITTLGRRFRAKLDRSFNSVKIKSDGKMQVHR